MLRFAVVLFLVAVAYSSPTENIKLDNYVPGYCKVGDHYIKEGEEGAGPLGECSRVTCVSAGQDKGEIMGVGCGLFVPPPECTMTDIDLTKLYPDCCPRAICPPGFED